MLRINGLFDPAQGGASYQQQSMAQLWAHQQRRWGGQVQEDTALLTRIQQLEQENRRLKDALAAYENAELAGMRRVRRYT